MLENDVPFIILKTYIHANDIIVLIKLYEK